MDLKQFIAGQIAARPIEARIVRKLYSELAANSERIVKVWDGEEYVNVSSEQDVLNEAFNLDELRVYTMGGDYVLLIMGEGADVIADYTVYLESSMQETLALAQRLGD